MWERGAEQDVVLKELDHAKSSDLKFSDGRIIGSMCTKPLEIAKTAHVEFIETNLGNAGLYPGTKGLETRVIEELSKLLNGRDLSGHFVNGGTEANITALWIARNTTGKREAVLPKSAHFSLLKACDLLSMKPVWVDLDSDYCMDLADAKNKITEDTAVVVGVAGTTELGIIDPIEELSELVPDSALLHVDAAFGGFIIPFLKDLGRDVPAFDFQIPAVSSITIDPHKMGMSTTPAGILLLRGGEKEDRIATEAPYLTLTKQTTLSGTRCSAAVAATYAAMRSLGREGYRSIVRDCMDVTEYAAMRAEKIGLEIVRKPVMNVLGILLSEEPALVQTRLDSRGWKVSVAKNPKCLRLVIMPHIKKDHIDRLFSDLEDVLR